MVKRPSEELPNGKRRKLNDGTDKKPNKKPKKTGTRHRRKNKKYEKYDEDAPNVSFRTYPAPEYPYPSTGKRGRLIEDDEGPRTKRTKRPAGIPVDILRPRLREAYRRTRLRDHLPARPEHLPSYEFAVLDGQNLTPYDRAAADVSLRELHTNPSARDVFGRNIMLLHGDELLPSRPGSRRPSIGDIAPATNNNNNNDPMQQDDPMQLDEYGFAAVPPQPLGAIDPVLEAEVQEIERQMEMALQQAVNAPVATQTAAVSSSVDVNPVEQRNPSLDPGVRNGNPGSGDQGTSPANIEKSMDAMYTSMFGGQRPNPGGENLQNMIMNGRRANATSLLVKPLVASGIDNPVERLVRSRQPLSDNGSRTIQPIYGHLRMY